jgi:hypothetical protein
MAADPAVAAMPAQAIEVTEDDGDYEAKKDRQPDDEHWRSHFVAATAHAPTVTPHASQVRPVPRPASARHPRRIGWT